MLHPAHRSPALTRDAFAELYDRAAPELLGWLRRQVEPDVARELLAETFSRAWAGRAAFDSARGAPEAWLFGIARHLLLSYWRRHVVEDRGRRRLGVHLPARDHHDDDVEERLDAEALGVLLRGALADLSELVRDAVLLRVVHHRTYGEIAQLRGCSPATARMRVSRGLRALRDDPQLSPAAAVHFAPGSLT
ncbi:MAG TPA: RNA polymerase sigma factor [Baekduia sp.]|jgi:RNA polymerase sigma-70 factor (ECF subfamily)